MSSKDVYDNFNSCIKDNILVCTEKELNEFTMYGLLFKTGNKYLTRNNQTLKVDLIKVKELNFDINLSNVINNCLEFAKNNNYKKVYYMSIKQYNKYKDKGLIVQIKNKEYYKFLNEEYWLINIF